MSKEIGFVEFESKISEKRIECTSYVPVTPRQHQIKVEDAKNLRLIDLFAEETNGTKHLSRADLILIYTLYPNGLMDFYEDYLEYVEREVRNKGYKVVNKPHYYLKGLID